MVVDELVLHLDVEDDWNRIMGYLRCREWHRKHDPRTVAGAKRRCDVCHRTQEEFRKSEPAFEFEFNWAAVEPGPEKAGGDKLALEKRRVGACLELDQFMEEHSVPKLDPRVVGEIVDEMLGRPLSDARRHLLLVDRRLRGLPRPVELSGDSLISLVERMLEVLRAEQQTERGRAC